MEREIERHTHNISFDKWPWWSENECLVTASHRDALFPIICSFFCLFSKSLPPSHSLWECQHYNFIRVASFSLVSYYAVCVCVFDKRILTNTYILNSHPLFYTLLVYLLLCLDWLAFRARVIIATCFPIFFHLNIFAPLLMTSFRTRSSRAQIYTQFHSCPSSFRCRFISNENLNHLPFGTLERFS